MERLNTRTHLIHNHSKVSEKRQDIYLLHTDHITYHCAEVSAQHPHPKAWRRHTQLLPTGQPPMGASSRPWQHYTKHPRGGEQQLIWARGWIPITNIEVAFQDMQLNSWTSGKGGKVRILFFYKSIYSSYTRRDEGTCSQCSQKGQQRSCWSPFSGDQH